jgi:phospholipid/cholesterol/gamma-HCH transport system permease protein
LNSFRLVDCELSERLKRPGALPAGKRLHRRRSFSSTIVLALLSFCQKIHGLVAFALITLGVTLTQFNSAAQVIHPLVRRQIHRAGVGLLPMISFLALALGFVIIGQTVSLLTRVGAQNYTGVVMVTVVVRELGPILAAVVVLARMGTATVVELGTARALGEVQALEALGIDPIHYLVMPRVLGLSIAIFCLTIYLLIGSLACGYLMAFLQDVPLTPGAYVDQLAGALRWEDFALLALKTLASGIIVGLVTCYEGLALPLRLEEVASATTRAVVDCVILWVLLDALLLVVYLIL